MNLTHAVALTLLSLACLAALALACRDHARAKQLSTAAYAQLDRAAADAHDLRRLQGLMGLEHAAPHDALMSLMASVLREAGVSGSALREVTPGAARDNAWARSGHQSATVLVEGITLPETGSVLFALREHAAPWRLSGIELTPQRAEAGPGTLRVRLTIEAACGPEAEQ